MSRHSIATFSQERGFLLFEVMVGVTVFALAALGLANALNASIDAALSLQKEAEIRIGLQTKLAELKAKPLNVEKKIDPPNEQGIVYENETQVIIITNDRKLQLSGIYRLSVRAKWKANGQDQEAIAEIYALQQ